MANCKDCVCSEVCYYKSFNDVRKLEKRRNDVEKICKSFVHRDSIKSPTVDAVEVVHAHWEDGCAIHNGKEVYKSIDCSNCNEMFKTEDREYWKKRFKVCPFCGAIMDG